jgi:hypothetical protein
MAEDKQKPVQYPTWRFAKDGRSQIVHSPDELKELEADGGDWRDAPHPAGTEYVPGGMRTFAAPVGTVDPRGAAARLDKPASEVALTTALPKNEAGSVPSDKAHQPTAAQTVADRDRVRAQEDEEKRQKADAEAAARGRDAQAKADKEAAKEAEKAAEQQRKADEKAAKDAEKAEKAGKSGGKKK